MKILGIIPARGGSKGIPGKNIKPLGGKPLIAWTIEAALESQLLHKIIVSSDNDDIFRVANKYKDQRLLFDYRPAHLATDSSQIIDTILYLLEKHKNFDSVMLLQPTSPIRTGEDIDEAIKLLANNPSANSVISVVPMDDVHPARMYWLEDNKELKSIMPQWETSRRQEIPKAYYRNGAIYLTRTQTLLEHKSLMVDPKLPLIMDYNYLLNIDEPRDLIIGDALIKAWKNKLL